MSIQLNSVAEALRARGFESLVFDTAGQAAAYILSDLPEGTSVGCGGSVTIQEMELAASLRKAGHEVFWHWDCAPGQQESMRRAAMNADAYLCSANALTTDGLIVQIDGTGNRVAAMSFGPKTVYVIVGVNKLVDGGYAKAVARIKQFACPPNARRLGLNTHCAKTGVCNPQECRASICHITAAFERAPGGKRTVVVLVNEALGY